MLPDNYCPEETCTTPVVDEDEPLQYGEGPYSVDYAAIDAENNAKCFLYNDPSYRDVSTFQCLSPCTPILNEAAEEGRTSNYGCMGYYPLDAPIPWDDSLGSVAMAPGICVCDNYLLNFIADTFIEALPIIAEVSICSGQWDPVETSFLTMTDRLLHSHVIPKTRPGYRRRLYSWSWQSPRRRPGYVYSSLSSWSYFVY